MKNGDTSDRLQFLICQMDVIASIFFTICVGNDSLAVNNILNTEGDRRCGRFSKQLPHLHHYPQITIFTFKINPSIKNYIIVVKKILTFSKIYTMHVVKILFTAHNPQSHM